MFLMRETESGEGSFEDMDGWNCKCPEIWRRKVLLYSFMSEDDAGSDLIPGRRMKGDT